MSNKRVPIIRYTSRDFQSLRNDILEYGKRNYGDSFKDQAFVGFGANLVDNIAYIGDILSFYLDYNVNESFLETSVEFNNIIRNAKQIGYKFSNNSTAHGTQTFYGIFPAAPNQTEPDSRYRGLLKKGSTLSSVNGDGFLLNEDVNFNSPNNEIVVARVNETTGFPTAFAIKATGKIISGRIVRELIEIEEFQKFLKVELQDPNIAEILTVRDSEGNEYYQVNHLAQDVIYRGIVNRDTNSNLYASRLLRPFIVPRRFVYEKEINGSYLQFGFGSESDIELDPLIDPSKVILEQFGKNYISDTSFDPTKLLGTNKLGVVPSNTTLEIIYRTNDGINVNSAVNSITTINNPIFEFNDISILDIDATRDIISSIETTNETPIVGDIATLTPEEIKQRAYGAFSTQNRAVTLEDYKAYTYQMPPEFGSIKRINVVQDNNSFKRNLNFYIISEDQNGFLIETNSVIKQNLRQWLSKGKMINDTIDILDAKIVNYGIDYTVIGELDIDKFEIRQQCDLAIQNKLRTLPEIGEPLFISEINKVLQQVENVVDVLNVHIRKKVGGTYSDFSFDFESQTSTENRFINVPKNVIMELKYPRSDIRGSVN